MAPHSRSTRWAPVALLSLLPLLYGCDKGTLEPPVAEAGGPMFARYVALGNSITAGFQSGGINESTQSESYAMLVAERFGLDLGTEFVAPLLNMPGCPPPLTNILTGETLGGSAAPPCALRKDVPSVLNNVAVPGAAVIDMLSNLAPGSDPNTLTTVILGGRTQLEAAAAVSPTFVTVWIGNNDWLGAALSRNASLATPLAEFTASYGQMLDALVAMGVEGGMLIGVADIVNSGVPVPHFSAGQFYLGLAQVPALPPTFSVSLSCAPTALGGVGDQVFVPFSYGFGVLADSASRGFPVTLECLDDSQVLTLAEVGQIQALVAGFNAAIEAEAQALGWAYWDPKQLFDSVTVAGGIPLIPDLTDPTGAPFGAFFSLDGLHPNLAAHQLVADHVIDVINATYGTNIP